jgi:hypothetical protein
LHTTAHLSDIDVCLPLTVPTPQPTSAPITTTGISISMSTEISNITPAEFNATAFSSAVIDVAAAVVSAQALPSLQVVITSKPSVTATATKSKRRRLQAVPNNSVTVTYDVRNLPDTATAAALQQRLVSTDGSTSLLNSYKALSGTAATAATTTAIKVPPVPPVHTAAPVAIIAGSVVGGVVLFVTAAALAVWCNKRRAATGRRALLHKAVADDTAALYNSSSSSKRFDSGSSFTSSSTTTTAAARYPLRHSSAHKFGSMLQAIDSDSAVSEHDSTATGSAVDVEQGNGSSRSSSRRDVHNSTSRGEVVRAPAATVDSSTVQQQQQQSAPTSGSNTTATTAATARNITGAAGAVRFAIEAPATTNDTTATTAITTSGSAAAAKQSQLATTSKQGWARRMSTHMTTAARRGVREHGEKAVVAWEGLGKG